MMELPTRLAHLGRDPERFEGLVNVPPTRASTIQHRNMAAFRAAAGDKHGQRYYGRYGTPISKMLEATCADLDGGDGAVLYSSGLAAIAGVLGAISDTGSHLLVVDSVYAPVREFCEQELARRGVATTFYPPDVGADIAALLRPETVAVYCESPGSLTFEMQDIPAICAAAARRGVPVVVDNTWATPYFFRPLEKGASIAIQSATKYLMGHSDGMLGVAVANDKLLDKLRRHAALNGVMVGADDCFTALRGLRTLGVRLRQHHEGATAVARWLAGRREVSRVLYPPMAHDADRLIWERDFHGASGLLGIELAPSLAGGIDEFVDGLQLFAIGVSWGGFESLILPSHPHRSLPQAFQGPLLRLHIGLEEPADLIRDLDAGLERLSAPNTRSPLR